MGAMARQRKPEPKPERSAGNTQATQVKTDQQSAKDKLREALGFWAELSETLLDTASDDDTRASLFALDGGEMKMHDVSRDVTDFGQQYALTSQHGLPMLCVADSGELTLPVNMSSVLFSLGMPRSLVEVEEQLGRIQESPWTPQTGELQLVDPDTAREGFKQRLANFLLRRQLGSSEKDPSPSVPPGYLEFTVHTTVPGMSVHFHPAYWRDTRAVYGGPSTPVKSFILPGSYTFGCVGYGHELTFENAVYEIPYATECTLTV